MYLDVLGLMPYERSLKGFHVKTNKNLRQLYARIHTMGMGYCLAAITFIAIKSDISDNDRQGKIAAECGFKKHLGIAKKNQIRLKQMHTYSEGETNAARSRYPSVGIKIFKSRYSTGAERAIHLARLKHVRAAVERTSEREANLSLSVKNLNLCIAYYKFVSGP
uniref:Uncharacterized protein n=1 Tax=Glossina pallidipes TaxID=7398 RepID=A0A1A9ZJZ6_GLOPL